MVDYPREGKTGFRRWLPSWKLVLGLVVVGAVAVVALLAVAVYLTPVPDPNEAAVAQSTTITYEDGTPIGTLGEVRRTSVPLSDVPLPVQQAVLAAEDRDFYSHGGFSVPGIGRALWNNLSGGDTQGGSTITQQYVKNAYLTQEQTLVRKFKELALAVKVETQVSKDEILENYLNTIYFGRGAYGIQAAAEAYFGKDARELTVAEGAVLAGIVQSPENFEPTENGKALRERWDYVLDGMVAQGWLSETERAAVEFPEFAKVPRNNALGGQRGYIVEAVKREMAELGFSEAELSAGGYVITTTIDKKVMAAAVAAVESAGPATHSDGVRTGAIAIRPGTGEILGLYGGPDYLENQLDNALQARAQGGSTFKAFTLAAAVDHGYPLNHMLNGDSPATIEGYTVNNFGGGSYGPVTLQKATASSINTAYVQMESEVGVKQSIDTAFALGLPEDTPGVEDNLTFVLGSASPRAVDMASAFATIAAHGSYADPTILKKVETFAGDQVEDVSPDPEDVLDANVADTATVALQTVVTGGSGSAAQALGRPAAGKTGTSEEAKSAWFVGYTPQFAAAVMMTRADKQGNPISLDGVGGIGSFTGGSMPTQIWTSFAQGALAGEPVEQFAIPSGNLASVKPSASESPSASQSPSESSAKPEPEPEPTESPSETEEPSESPSESESPKSSPSP